jgi:hypothetical protein
MLAALRLAERESKLDLAQLGLALGLGWWATPQIAILGLPAVVWLVWKRPRLLRGAWIALPAFVLGGLPWWVDNVRHGWPSLHLGTDETSKFGHLHNLVSVVLPMGLGLRLPYSLTWFPQIVVGVAFYLVFLAGFAWLLLRRPRGLGPALLAAVVFPVFYVVSPYTWLATEPRYLTLIAPMFAVLLAAAARTRARAIAVVAGCLAMSFGAFAEIDARNVTAAHSDKAVLAADFHPLLRLLDAHRVRYLYADYWIAYRIDFESGEHIVAGKSSGRYRLVRGRIRTSESADPGSQGRYPAYNHAVDASRDAAIVFAHGSDAEPHDVPLLRRAGYRLVTGGGFDVWLAPRT